MSNSDPNLSRDFLAKSSAEAAAWMRKSLGPRLQSNNDNVTNDIAAELADHLAESTTAARVRGLNEEQAKAHAANRFGDVAAILRQCWWIKKGEVIMFRSAAIILGCICVIGLFTVAYSAWRIEASFTDQMGTLSQELSELNETGARFLSQPQATQMEIAGHLYLGDPSVPAASGEVEIWDAMEMTVVRRVRSEADGSFRSGALTFGDYFVIAPLQGMTNEIVTIDGNKNAHHRYAAQSQTIALHTASGTEICNMDVLLPNGGLAVEIVGDLPRVAADGLARVHLHGKFLSGYNTTRLPWDRDKTLPDAFPLHGTFQSSHLGRQSYSRDQSTSVPLENGNLTRISPYIAEANLPAGRHQLLLTISLNPNVPFEQLRDMPPEDRSERFEKLHILGGYFYGGVSKLDNEIREARSPLGTTIQTEGDENPEPRPVIPAASSVFEIRNGELTRLRLVVPDGFAAALDDALGKIDQPDADIEAIVNEMSKYPLALELAGYEPL